jgi:transcriptional antiterminator Rof (Rho-off)
VISQLGDLDEHELPCLAYKDITLKLHNGAKLVSLVANVVIRNEKGKK